MRQPFKCPQKTSFIHYEGWGFYLNYLSEAPTNEQRAADKNANKIIARQIKRLNQQAFQNKFIRSR